MKRITFITGHYGSGKSEFSVNLALLKQVDYLIDLDIVNPYFRSRELEGLLGQASIEMISSPLKDALGSDLPFISARAYEPFQGKEKTAIFDLGGDDVGAKVTRQFLDRLDIEEVDVLLCINVYREKTSSKEGIHMMVQQIEGASGLKITGLINNSNFLRDTNYEDLLIGEKILQEVAKERNISIKYTGVYENIVKMCGPLAGEVIPLKLYLRKKWL
jgi:hypothetical protein